jgi:hypothetical protein
LITRNPFWVSLSPTAVKQRTEQILNAPDAAQSVRQLSPVEYIVLLKESPDTRLQLLALADPHQIRTVLDLDCWHKDSLQTPQVLAWLDELRRSGPDVFVQALSALDSELLIATFRQHLRVHAALPPEEEDEAGQYDEALHNELYRIEFVDQDPAVQEGIRRFFRTLRMADLALYHNLMQSIMWGLESESAEWAYRWKSGRLQDEGFPDYYEALETYGLLDLDQPARVRRRGLGGQRRNVLVPVLARRQKVRRHHHALGAVALEDIPQGEGTAPNFETDLVDVWARVLGRFEFEVGRELEGVRPVR